MSRKPLAEQPVRDDRVTIGRGCEACGRAFPRRGRARFCSAACRQRAYRARQAATPPPDTSSHQLQPLYECPGCSERLLGERRCPDCNLFCRKLGPGALCPHCDQPLALAELLA